MIDKAVASGVNPSETILISGFWRSGTTWLQESLAGSLPAKTVFEPFSPKSGAFLRAMTARHPDLKGRPASFWLLFIPFSSPDKPVSEGLLDAYISRVMAGTLRGKFHRFTRSFGRSLSHRVVVKTVQGALILKAIRKRYANPLILLRRDPRSIIASLKRAPWFDIFQSLSLREQLLDVDDGRAVHFQEFEDHFHSLDRKSPVERIAAYWAVQELYLQREFPPVDDRLAVVNYEDLLYRNTAALEPLLSGAARNGMGAGRLKLMQQQSRNSRGNGTYFRKSAHARIFSWKETLTAGEIAAIERVVQLFGLEARLYEG